MDGDGGVGVKGDVGGGEEGVDEGFDELVLGKVKVEDKV